MSESTSKTFGGSIKDVIHDLLMICDLQLRLLTLDLRESSAGVRRGAVLLTLSVVILIGSVPVLFLGLAGLIQKALGLRQDVALIVVGGCCGFAGVTVLLLAVRQIVGSFAPLRRSHQEFSENLKWLRNALNRESG